ESTPSKKALKKLEKEKEKERRKKEREQKEAEERSRREAAELYYINGNHTALISVPVESIVIVEGVISKPSEEIKSTTVSDAELHIKKFYVVHETVGRLPFSLEDASRCEEEINKMAFEEHYHEVLDILDELFVFIFDGLKTRFSSEIETVKRQYPAANFEYLPKTLRLDFKEAVQLLRDH
ncbi:15765_t:CDS:2, partial [Racocetra fulgida]